MGLQLTSNGKTCSDPQDIMGPPPGRLIDSISPVKAGEL